MGWERTYATCDFGNLLAVCGLTGLSESGEATRLEIFLAGFLVFGLQRMLYNVNNLPQFIIQYLNL